MSSRAGRLRGWLVSLLIVAVILGIGAIVWFRTIPKAVDGIPCNLGEQLATHYHAHLAVIYDGQGHFPPANIGIHYEHLCFYWLHTHDSSGIIHIEAPHGFKATLGQFFDIWGQPLSRQGVWSFAPQPPQSLRVFVDQRSFPGNPRDIVLRRHTSVVVEIGPPFIPPPLPIFPKGF